MLWLSKLVRSLRFRLTVSYVAFFAVLLVLIGWGFRRSLQSELESEVRDVLEAEWDAAKGYIEIDNERPVWTADITDPEDNHIVERLKYVHMVADANGNVLTDSPVYESIGIDTPAEIHKVLTAKEPLIRTRYSSSGEPFMIKAGSLPGKNHGAYFFAIGRTLADAQRTVQRITRTYFLFLPVVLAITGVLGWFLAGRAIRPVYSVALAAQALTGSNLSMKIPLRGAGDELDHLIDSFNRMTGRLQKTFDQMRQFSTDVSHELRTPLTAVRGQLEVALFTAENKEQYQDAIVTALEAVEQLSSIVRALLLLSQAESGQVVLQKEPLNLGEVATDIADQFQIPAEEKNLHLTSIVEESVVIPADRIQIERLLSNLLSNAVKYTPAGGSVTVRIGRDEGTNQARLVVEDTGVGIPAENLPHIFDRFYRVRNPETNKIQGLGLGLSFVAWIVSAHGGQIDVHSRAGEGTRFTILLPTDGGALLRPTADFPAMANAPK